MKVNELQSKNIIQPSSSVTLQKSPDGMISNVMLFDKAQQLKSNITDVNQSPSALLSSMTSSSNNFMNRYQTRNLVKAENRKIVLRKNVELKAEDANDSVILVSNPTQRLTLFQDKKRDYRSQHNLDFNSNALKEKARDMETRSDSKKFPEMSSINKETTNKHDLETNMSAYNIFPKSDIRSLRSPMSLKKNAGFEQISEEEQADIGVSGFEKGLKI